MSDLILYSVFLFNRIFYYWVISFCAFSRDISLSNKILAEFLIKIIKIEIRHQSIRFLLVITVQEKLMLDIYNVFLFKLEMTIPGYPHW